MLKTNQEDEHHLRVDVFEPDDNFLTSKNYDGRKRDSGYGTDYSPASLATTSRQFTFDSDIEESEFDLSEEFRNMDVNNDVFIDTNVQDPNRSVCDESDDVDKEVEELLSESGELGQSNTMSEPMEIHSLRPRAPVPTPDDIRENGDTINCVLPVSISSDVTDYARSRSYNHMRWNVSRHCRKYHFRPISRSVGTQTPSPHSHVIPEAFDTFNRPRFQPYQFANGNGVGRLRRRSGNDEHGNFGPLPDIVQFPRDRSVSLPDIPTLRTPQEQEVGRELRRISDEFDSSLNKDRTRQTGIHRTSSFTFNIDVIRYFSNIRRLLSPSPQEGTEEQNTSADKPASSWY